jgi:mono/diheme cytochrome c family protein/uncharacterized membrane protein
MLTCPGHSYSFVRAVRPVLVGLAGWPLFVPPAASAQTASPKPPPAAREVFSQHCVKCHGKDGTGNQARSLQPDIPDFTAAAWQSRRSETQLRVSIIDGKGRDMPPFSGKITDAQARELVTHVRTFAPSAEKSGSGKSEQNGSPEGVDEKLRRLQQELDDLKKQSPEPPSKPPQNSLGVLIGWSGRYHAPAVHFPIALLTAAAVAEVLHLATGRRSYAAVSRFCVRFGALAAAGAGILGWFAGDFRLSDASWVMTTHRWLGTCTVACAGLVLTLGELCRSPERRRTRACFRATLFSCALLALTTGFFGGAVVNGIDHYAWPQ